MNIRKILGAAAAAISLVALPMIGSASTTLTVTASVTNSCSWNTISYSASFGTWNPLTNTASTANPQATLAYECTNGDTPTLKFTTLNGSGSQCAMTDGTGGTIDYGISVGSTFGTQVDCSGGTGYSGTQGVGPSSVSQVLTLGIDSDTNSQNANQGSYTDTVTITITP
jgi:spore coat protein U-like protein